MPWGRDGNEFCQGHQCWRGRTAWAITSTAVSKPAEAQLVEGREAPFADHVGIKTPGGVRNDLSRSFPRPRLLSLRHRHRRQPPDLRLRPARQGRRHLAGRAGRTRQGPGPQVHLSPQSALLLERRRPHPPLPLARRHAGILQLRRVRRAPGVYDPRLAGPGVSRKKRREGKGRRKRLNSFGVRVSSSRPPVWGRTPSAYGKASDGFRRRTRGPFLRTRTAKRLYSKTQGRAAHPGLQCDNIVPAP